MRVLCLLLLVGCRSPSMRVLEIEQPASVVIGYMSSHNLIPGFHHNVELRTVGGTLIEPVDTDSSYVEAHYTTKYYVIAPGTYRLFGYRGYPDVKTLRRTRPGVMVGSRVEGRLDPRTDANDDHGWTRDTWRVVPRHGGGYFVLVEEPTHDGEDDFYVTANGGERKRASGVTWVGPFEGESVIELGMWNAGVRRYSLTVARSADSAPAPATAELGEIVRGHLGPASAWVAISEDFLTKRALEMGWESDVRITNDVERPLYVVVGWSGDHKRFYDADVAILDESGHHVGTSGREGVFTTRPVGNATVRLRGTGSGRFSVCASASPTDCIGRVPSPLRALGE